MQQCLDYTGQRIGKLYIVGKAKNTRSQWVCQCDCGNVRLYMTCHLKNHKSCGCFEQENRENLKFKPTHGMTETILYKKYCNMKGRIHNPNYKYFFRYGGRGIKICPEWENSFEAFCEWAYENGYDDNKKGYEQTLDRIDVDGDYCPENCRWVTQKVQCRNTSLCKYIEYNGEKITVSEFCERNNITYHAFVTRRLKKGKTLYEILDEWNDNHNTDDYMTAKEAADYYKVDYRTVLNWVDKGLLQAKKTENKVLILKGQTVQHREDRDEKGRFIKGIVNK